MPCRYHGWRPSRGRPAPGGRDESLRWSSWVTRPRSEYRKLLDSEALSWRHDTVSRGVTRAKTVHWPARCLPEGMHRIAKFAGLALLAGILGAAPADTAK